MPWEWVPLSAICWGCSKLFMHSTNMSRHCFWSKFYLLLIICSSITGKTSQVFCMNHSVYKHYRIQNCTFACCCSMGKKRGLSHYDIGWRCWERWESNRTLEENTCEELLDLCSLPNINRAIKGGRMKLAARSARGEERSACKVVLRKSERSRWLAVARHRWNLLCV